MDATRLSALVASRICHDLASPTQSLSFTLEGLKEPGLAGSPESLVSQANDALAGLTSKLKFLRYALGSEGLQAGEADPRTAESLTREYLKDKKRELVWNVSGPLSFRQAGLMMNLALIGSSAVTSRHGTIELQATTAGDSVELSMTARGERVGLSEDLRASLEGREPPVEGWQAKNIQPRYAAKLAEQSGARIEISETPEGLVARCLVKT